MSEHIIKEQNKKLCLFDCRFENKIIDMIESDAANQQIMIRIEDKIDDVNSRLGKQEDSRVKWHIFVCGLAVTIITSIIGFTYIFGQMTNVVQNNQKRLEKISNVKSDNKVIGSIFNK